MKIQEKKKKEPMEIFPFYIDKESRKKALNKSKNENKSLASVIRDLIKEWLK